MENKEINLEVIVNQYRNKGAAYKAYRDLHKLITKNKNEEIEILLRHHLEKEVTTDEEINKRDNIDFLIDFYSIIEIALIAGYIPNPLPSKLKNEIIYLFSNKFLKRYFSKYYPIMLPQLLLKQVETNELKIYIKNKTSLNSYLLFERFLMLRHYLKEDSDINQFLWFLDDGWTEGYSISDLWNVLGNQELIQYKLGRSKRHPLNKALWGFVKYIQFLSEYATLIRDSNDNILLQSALWHHQSYWFKSMNNRLGEIVTIGINNIRNSIIHTTKDNRQNSIWKTRKELLNWEEDSNIFDEIEKDIKYLLNEKLGDELLNYYETY